MIRSNWKLTFALISENAGQAKKVAEEHALMKTRLDRHILDYTNLLQAVGKATEEMEGLVKKRSRND